MTNPFDSIRAYKAHKKAVKCGEIAIQVPRIKVDSLDVRTIAQGAITISYPKAHLEAQQKRHIGVYSKAKLP